MFWNFKHQFVNAVLFYNEKDCPNAARKELNGMVLGQVYINAKRDVRIIF